MGRAPCCDKANVKKGPWSPEEDTKLKKYIETNGTGGNWITLPSKAGLKRCGKSCRLRWINYLRPDIKHGSFTEEEERIIYQLHAGIGSRWSVIALQLPGRTDNDIKNYWNTRLKKKLAETGSYPHLQCMQRNFTMSSTPSQLPALTSYPPDGDMLHVMNAQQQHHHQSQMMYSVGQQQLPYNADVGPSHASPLNSHVNQAYVGAIRQHQYIQQHTQQHTQQQFLDQYRAEQLELQRRSAEEWDRPELLYQGLSQPSQEVQEIVNFGDEGSKFKELYSSLASCLGSGAVPALAESGVEAKFEKILPVNAAAQGSDVLAGNLQPTDMTSVSSCNNTDMSRLSGSALVPTQIPNRMELSRHHSPTSSCSASEGFSACNNYHDDSTNLVAEDPQSMDSPEVLPSTPMTSLTQCTIGDLDEFSSFLDWPQGVTVKEEPTELNESNQLKPPSRQSSLPPRRELQWSVSSPRCAPMNVFASPLRTQTASTQALDSDPFKSNNFIAT